MRVSENQIREMLQKNDSLSVSDSVLAALTVSNSKSSVSGLDKGHQENNRPAPRPGNYRRNTSGQNKLESRFDEYLHGL